MTKITGRISSDAPLIRTTITGAGPKGQSVEYVWVGTRLGLKMEGDEEFIFVDLKGDSIELQINAEYIQWKNSTDTEWQNLIPLADLKGERGFTGEQGDAGPRGEQGVPGEQGEDGERGIQGPKGDDGYTPIKGTDYWTTTDQTAIVADVLAAVDESILGGAS